MLDLTMDGETQKHRKRPVANQTVSIAQYRHLAKRFNYFLKQHDKRKEEFSHYRARCYDLEAGLLSNVVDRLNQAVDSLAPFSNLIPANTSGINAGLGRPRRRWPWRGG